MLDIRLIREQPDFVKSRIATRGGDDQSKIDELLEVDTQRRKMETALQQCNADRKRLSKEIGGTRSRGEDSAELEERVRQIGDEIAELVRQTAVAEERQRDLLLNIPNLPHANAPVGTTAADNPVVRSWGEKPQFDFPVLDHVALGARRNLFDVERATKLSGSGFICFTGAGARLERALIQFMLDLHTREHGYLEVSPPFLVRRDCMIGTTQLPKFEDDMYGLEGGAMFLAPTAEVPVTNLHREEILAEAELPKKFTAYTPCFRREAGSAGRETRGILRVHQFDKVELVKITTPENSYVEHEALTADAERVLQSLGLHYRVIELCTGDLGFGCGQNLRPRSLVAGAGYVSRSFELLELRGFPGAPDESAFQGRGWEESVLPHLEWLGHSPAQALRRAHRGESTSGWFDPNSRSAATLFRRSHALDNC